MSPVGGLPVRPLPRDAAASRWCPYGKLGLDYAYWQITDGNGDIATDGTGGHGRGGTLGWHAAAGLALVLDFFDPEAARDFDSDLGVNHTALMFEYTHADISGLGQANRHAPRRHHLVARACCSSFEPRRVSLRSIRAAVEYDGTDFSGWQRQPGSGRCRRRWRTPSASMTGETVFVRAAGRTDAGVHADGQVGTFDSGARTSRPTASCAA